MLMCPHHRVLMKQVMLMQPFSRYY